MKRIDAIKTVVADVPDLPIVVTLAATSRELAAVADRDNHLYLLDSMGLAPSVGTGLALALENSAIDRVLVLEGDGSLFMNLNALATLGYHRPHKLIVAVLDNGTYASTGGFNTYSSRVNLSTVAISCGINVLQAQDEQSLSDALKICRTTPGPHLIHVRIDPGNAPRIPLLLQDPVVLGARFRAWLVNRTDTGATSV